MRLKHVPKQINVLYVEDDPKILDVMYKVLNAFEHTHFNVVTKRTLKEALDYLCECTLDKTINIDVILLDLVLPNSHGVGTFLKVKQQCGDIPVVIISGHEEMACKCVSLGAQDYLVKPDIPPALLIRALKYAIQRNELEHKMKSVIMTSTLGYHMYELKGDDLIFVGFNPSANKILGVDNVDFIGKKISDAFPGLPSYVEENYRKALNGVPWTNQHVEYESDKIKKSIFRVNAYKTSENFLTVTFEDITEKIKIKTALAKTLEDYKNLVEVTGASIFGMDFVNQKFTYVNDVMCKTLGYTREELLNMWPSDYLTPKSKEEFNARIEALKRGDFVHNNVEYECLRKDGSIVWVLVTTSYPDINQPIITANAVAINITEKKLVEQELEKKEFEVFSELEKRIHIWKDEMVVKSVENQNRLRLIDAEILKLSHINKVGA